MTNSRSPSKPMSIESVIPSAILSSVVPKTHINQINKDQTQRTNIKSSKGRTTNNTQGNSHKDNRRSFNRNSSDQKGMAAAAAAKSLQSCLILCCPGDCSPPGSSIHGDSPGKNTRMGCQALLQGIFPTRGSDLDLLHCRHQESPHKYTHACKHKRSWCTCIHIHTRVCIRTLTHAYRHTREHVYGD